LFSAAKLSGGDAPNSFEGRPEYGGIHKEIPTTNLNLIELLQDWSDAKWECQSPLAFRVLRSVVRHVVQGASDVLVHFDPASTRGVGRSRRLGELLAVEFFEASFFVISGACPLLKVLLEAVRV